MKYYLLIDFGATSVKGAMVDIDTGHFSHVSAHPSHANCSKQFGRYEIPLLSIKEQFLNICKLYTEQHKLRFEGIVICSQMHGFALLDGKNMPASNYISWKDERSLDEIDGVSSFALLNREVGDSLKRITGMRPRPGLPLMNALHLARSGEIGSGLKIVTLPEWLALCNNDSCHLVHDTMIAGTGFYDIYRKEISKDLTRLINKIAGIDFTFNTIAPTGAISGYWHSDAGKIPIYAGVGDHQCAVLGAGNTPGKSISINLGTGSQVSIIDGKPASEEIEFRPFFDSGRLATITHIPAGRVISEYLRLFEYCVAAEEHGGKDRWKALSDLSETDVSGSDLEFDLGLFKSAWRYKGGGKISNISEGNLTQKNYLASLLRCFVAQYHEAINIIDPDHKIELIILSGGISRRIEILAQMLSAMARRRALNGAPIDDTFLGLRAQAVFSARRMQSCFEAQKIFGRDVIVKERN